MCLAKCEIPLRVMYANCEKPNTREHKFVLISEHFYGYRVQVEIPGFPLEDILLAEIPIKINEQKRLWNQSFIKINDVMRYLKREKQESENELKVITERINELRELQKEDK